MKIVVPASSWRVYKMRRNWRGVLLFALALAVQAFAPAAANIAMSQASGDPRFSIEICLQAGGGSADDNHQLPGPRNGQRGACLLCQVCCGGVAPLESRSDAVGAAPVQWTALACTVADCTLPALRHEYSHQARAPPVFS